MADDGLRDYAGGDEKFLSWLRRVNAVIEGRAGVGLLDLPDFAYRDAFDAGEPPGPVALTVLEEEGL